MSFKSVQESIAKRQGVSAERAGAMLAAGTRRNMQKHDISTAHGIPKGVWDNLGNYKRKQKKLKKK